MPTYLITYRTSGFDFSIQLQAHDFDDAVKKAKEQAERLFKTGWVITMAKEVEK